MDARERITADLNDPQRAAVMHKDGPLLVLAGPGSGKTRVITRRCAYLVHSGVPARQILAITFTNKAADEMRRRIESLGVARGMWVYTFHALGARLLREFGPLANVQAGFSIYDQAEQKRVIKDAMKLCDITPEMIRPEEIAARISAAKSQLRTPASLEQDADFMKKRVVAEVYAAYEQLLAERNAVDFDDLLMRVVLVLQEHERLAAQLNERFAYLCIDEYQDTNRAQYLIARLLSQQHHNICATGDPDQSIYGWRGADLGNILEFEQDYPDAAVIRLEQNYRSTGNICRVASALIRQNQRRKHKDIWTEHDAGPPVEVWEFGDGRDEAERIAETILRLQADGRSWGDCAVCYRVNAISRGLEEALHSRSIPYKIVRGVEFYNRLEIKDTLAYLHLLVNPADEIALLRVINRPARGIGKTTVERLQQAARRRGLSMFDMARQVDAIETIKKAAATRISGFVALIDSLADCVHGGVADAVTAVLEQSGLEALYSEQDGESDEDRLANLNELITAATRYEQEAPDPSLAEFLQQVSLVSDQDAIDDEAGAVLLMTLHAAKGLEFPVVFLAGLEQGMLPHERSIEAGDIEEERRLFFVGVTRAMERLYISHADERYSRGRITARIASQFLQELPEEATRHRCFGQGLRRGLRSGTQSFATLSADFARQRRARSKRRGWDHAGGEDEAVFTPDDPTGAVSDRPAQPDFAGWAPGTLVRHDHFGVGQIVWIRPGAGKTRASIRFLEVGEKTFILEAAPIHKLGRDS